MTTAEHNSTIIILTKAYLSVRIYCQTPVPSTYFSLGLGVDFVLPLSQEQQEEQEQQEPHQNIPEGNILEVLNLAKSLTKPNQTHATPILTLTLLPRPPTLTLPSSCKKKQFLTQTFFRLKSFYRQSFSRPKFFQTKITF